MDASWGQLKQALLLVAAGIGVVVVLVIVAYFLEIGDRIKFILHSIGRSRCLVCHQIIARGERYCAKHAHYAKRDADQTSS